LAESFHLPSFHFNFWIETCCEKEYIALSSGRNFVLFAGCGAWCELRRGPDQTIVDLWLEQNLDYLKA